jgi:hypothetical protein
LNIQSSGYLSEGANRKMMMITAAKTELTTEENHYATTDLSLSAFLIARGHQLARVLREQRRGVFVFRNSSKLQADVLTWANNQPVSIRVREFANAQRDLKGLVRV